MISFFFHLSAFTQFIHSGLTPSLYFFEFTWIFLTNLLYNSSWIYRFDCISFTWLDKFCFPGKYECLKNFRNLIRLSHVSFVTINFRAKRVQRNKCCRRGGFAKGEKKKYEIDVNRSSILISILVSSCTRYTEPRAIYSWRTSINLYPLIHINLIYETFWIKSTDSWHCHDSFDFFLIL